jgi:spermidine/putrescine-binding protein
VSWKRRRRRRSILVLLCAILVAASAYAFTAANTVPASTAGSGAGNITGYTATAVTYTLNAANPQNVDQVAFTISPTTTATVKVQLVTGGTWYACTNSGGSVTCNTTVGTQATAAAANSLTVVAAQ